jgi:hypothetical protein
MKNLTNYELRITNYELFEKPENGFLPDLSAIPEEVAQKAKALVITHYSLLRTILICLPKLVNKLIELLLGG